MAALNSANTAVQKAILLWRTVATAKENPIGRIGLAFSNELAIPAPDGAISLPDLETMSA